MISLNSSILLFIIALIYLFSIIFDKSSTSFCISKLILFSLDELSSLNLISESLQTAFFSISISSKGDSFIISIFKSFLKIFNFLKYSDLFSLSFIFFIITSLLLLFSAIFTKILELSLIL